MRPRKFGYDYAYGIEHMERFPEQYERIEHRFKLADIDWTEFCGYCHKPVMLVEMRRDTPRGVLLADKPSTVIGHLATAAGIPAYALGVYTERPREVQARIDELNRQVLDLTRQHRITRFRAQLRVPFNGKVVTLDETGDWWKLIVLCHSWHHAGCPDAQKFAYQLARPEWLRKTARDFPGLWVPPQPMLPGMDEPCAITVDITRPESAARALRAHMPPGDIAALIDLLTEPDKPGGKQT